MTITIIDKRWTFLQIAEESAHLAPHGVPGGGMPKALSNTKLEEQVPQEQYGENLNVPGGGANNPFLQEQTENYSYTADGRRIEANQDQYYGAGYSQAQSGYSSSGFGNRLWIPFYLSLQPLFHFRFAMKK